MEELAERGISAIRAGDAEANIELLVTNNAIKQ